MAKKSSETSSMAEHSVYVVSNQEFIVRREYELTKEMGHGAYGLVCASRNEMGEGVAIKKICNVFSRTLLAKRALREIRLLRHFRNHKNITHLYYVDLVDPDNFKDIYLYEELMEADLHAIIRSGQHLTDSHLQSFIYQTLLGLKYIHSANVLHRDIKPGNLLVNRNCTLKICDFGLARGTDMNLEKNQPSGFMTEYVATRWYRAPEVLLGSKDYTSAIDVWSVGCILAELLGRRPFFEGRDYVDQLDRIITRIGKPPKTMLMRLQSHRARQYIESLPDRKRQDFRELFPDANPNAIDLLNKFLKFDPRERIRVDDALKHPYLAQWHDKTQEIECPFKFDFEFEDITSIESMKEEIRKEALNCF